jgi:hypothetical protein
MDIYTEKLKEYFSLNGEIVDIGITEIEGTTAIFFSQGNHKIFRSHQDLINILTVNKKIGVGGSIKNELDKLGKRKDGIESERRNLNIEIEIYDTLTKYIIEMLRASRGKRFFPEIVSLKKDETYFRRD